MQSDPRGIPGAAAPLPMGKLPQVTLAFWVMKICATTLGETAGDLLSMTLNVGYGLSSIILISLFAVSLTAQLASNRFHPLLYFESMSRFKNSGGPGNFQRIADFLHSLDYDLYRLGHHGKLTKTDVDHLDSNTVAVARQNAAKVLARP